MDLTCAHWRKPAGYSTRAGSAARASPPPRRTTVRSGSSGRAMVAPHSMGSPADAPPVGRRVMAGVDETRPHGQHRAAEGVSADPGAEAPARPFPDTRRPRLRLPGARPPDTGRAVAQPAERAAPPGSRGRDGVTREEHDHPRPAAAHHLVVSLRRLPHPRAHDLRAAIWKQDARQY